MIADQYIYKKEVDKSLLNWGFSIPVSIQQSFHVAMKGFIKRGERKDISLIIEGNRFEAKLTNQKFYENKFKGHTDVLQMRYSPGGDLANWLRRKFHSSAAHINRENLYQVKAKSHVKIPESKREYILIYLSRKV